MYMIAPSRDFNLCRTACRSSRPKADAKVDTAADWYTCNSLHEHSATDEIVQLRLCEVTRIILTASTVVNASPQWLDLVCSGVHTRSAQPCEFR